MNSSSVQILVKHEYRVPWYFHVLNALSWFDITASIIEELYIRSNLRRGRIYAEWLEYTSEGLSNSNTFSYYIVVAACQGCVRNRQLGAFAMHHDAEAYYQELIKHLEIVGTKTFCKQYRIPGRLFCLGKQS